MVGNTKRQIGALAIAGLVSAGLVGVTSMSASGGAATLATEPVLVPYGKLTIQLTSSGASYALDLAGTDVDPLAEPITTGQPCATVLPGSGQRLVLSPTTGTDTVQIRNNAFGVNTGGTSCGASAAAVISGNERLTMILGPGLPSGVMAKSAAVKVTRVKSGNLTVGLDGGAQGSATTITQSPQSVTVDPTVETPTDPFTADDLFTSITFASTSTKDGEGLSIADGTSFELVKLSSTFDIAVDCLEFVTKVGGSTDAASSATYERLDNKTGTTAECQEVGVKVQLQPATPGNPDASPPTPARVYWNNAFTAINSPTTAQTVQAYFTIVWTPTSDPTKLNRVIDYDAELPAQTDTAMQWCAGFLNGIPILPTSPATGVGILVGEVWKAPWCLVEDLRVLAADGKIVQTQNLFGSGDPWAR